MGSIRNKTHEEALTRLEWMRARGYSDVEIAEYLKRKEKNQKARG
jgi:hypothetical protein